MGVAEYICIDGFLPADVNCSLLEWAYGNEARFVPSRVGYGQENDRLRVSRSLDDLGPNRKLLRNAVRDRLPEFAEGLGLHAYEMTKFDAELVAHNEGAFFGPHNDIGGPDSVAGTRLISAVYYFNREPKGYSGGELRIYPLIPSAEKPPIEIEPKNNMLLVFRAMSVHEVCRVNCPTGEFRNSRFAINFWAHRKIAA